MAGKIVETKLGRGQTKNGDKPVNGKIIVYLDNGKKILCDPKNIKPIEPEKRAPLGNLFKIGK